LLELHERGNHAPRVGTGGAGVTEVHLHARATPSRNTKPSLADSARC